MSLHLPSGSTSGPSGNLHFGATRTLNKEFSSATDADRLLALKVFSGTVLEAFRAKTVFYDNTGNIMAMKMLNGGHVAQWPVIGDDVVLADIGTFTDASDPADGDWLDGSDSVVKDDSGLLLGYHTPGDFIAGRKIKMSERTVRVDDTLVSAIDIPFQDMDLSHFDVIRPYATKLGRALAIDNDKKIATMAMKAARTAAVSGVHPGGQVAHNAASGTGDAIDSPGAFPDDSDGAANFRKHAAMLAEMFDNDNVPEDGRYLFISPYIRRILRRELDVFNRDYNPDTIAGDLNSRTIGLLEGFNLVLTNHIPTGTTGGRYEAAFGSAISGGMHKYDYNNTGADESTGVVAAIALCGASEGSAGVGMVQASGIRTVVEDDERRNVKFMKAQMMVGYDVLSPWCAGIISTGIA